MNNRLKEPPDRLGSYLCGANTYMAPDSEYRNANEYIMDSAELLDIQDERELRRVVGEDGKHLYWAIRCNDDAFSLGRYLDILEGVYADGYTQKDLVWPVDVIRDDESDCYLIRPIDGSVSSPLRNYMPKLSDDQLTIARGIFQRIGELHGMGFVQNGLHPDAIRFDPVGRRVLLWIDERISSDGRLNSVFLEEKESFFLIPKRAREKMQMFSHCGMMADVFSAAVMAFYLLCHGHPFVGQKYTNVLREDYINLYAEDPIFIFEKNGENVLSEMGNMHYTRLVQSAWDGLSDELKELFSGIFGSVGRKGKIVQKDAFWDVERWKAALDGYTPPGAETQGEFEFRSVIYQLV